MRWLRKLAAVFRKRQIDDDLGEELGAHIDMLADDNVKLGMSETEARRAARITVGNLGVAHELHRDARGLPALESVLQDLRYAFRTLRRDYGFTIVAVLILGLGIGANATVFSLVKGLLLLPLPFPEADRLVWIENGDPENPGDTNPSALASRVAIYEQWLEFNNSFEDLAAYNPFFVRGSFTLTGGGEPERLMGVRVTGNLFPLLGVEPHMGRYFTHEETLAEGPPAAILSHGLWQRRFGGDAGVVGHTIELNDRPVTVVAVLPADFDFGSLFTPGLNVEVFIPAVLSIMTNWGNTIAVVGRLQPEVELAAAQAELDAINERLIEERADQGTGYIARVSSLQGHVSKSVRNALWVLWGAVGMVLLIVCANLSNLLLVRGVSRRGELAVRGALGAGKGRLVRQFLTESLVLSGLGAILGIGLAWLAVRLIVSSQAVVMPMLERVQLDAVGLGFALLVTVVIGVVVGTAPALQVSRRDPAAAMSLSGRGALGDQAHSWTRSSLVVAEIALACVLLVGAGLLARSFMQILDVELGFRPEHTAMLRVEVARATTAPRKSSPSTARSPRRRAP